MAELEILDGVREVPREEWDGLVGPGSPFLEWGWLASLEEAGAVGGETGWAPRPLVAREGGRLVAAAPLYVKGHSEGEFVFDWSWADAAQRAGIEYYPKLLVGVPFTPVAGRRLLVRAGEEEEPWARRLGAALRELCERNRLSGVHVNFCLPDEIEALRAEGYALRIGVQYHWRNPGYRDFGDYLAGLRSKRRNQIRRERRALAEAGVEVTVHAGDEIPEELFESMYRFYRRTVDVRPWGRRYLPPAFFELLRERFRDRLCFVVARQGGEPIAGTTNVQKGGVLYGRYWGADREIRHLHFDVCYYAAIEHCIRQGIERFEPGAGGDYKQVRGFDAVPTYSLHRMTDPRLRSAVERFLDAERGEAERAIDWLRDHSAFKPSETA